jgi:Putative peptidoglycan binding domain
MALTWPLEQKGSTGENVRSIQYLLNARASATEQLVVDGIFGSATDAAVRAFQAEHGLTADGDVGNQTWPVLIIEVSPGSTGDAVEAVQWQLRSRSDLLAINGNFDAQTEGVVRHFQGFCDLTSDGIVGPNTWNALTLQWLRASSGRSAAELVFQAWSKGDRTAARYEAIPPAVDTLFARKYEAGWTFGACQDSGATFACTWQRTGDKLILEGNNSTLEPVYAPFYFVNNVASEI